ncbi:uncharacterized protein PV09_06932 [Verruconis gallopava]|uniref:Uncharacterized protein n=1 Tax=Verruconis gallopava TaxID=253628 RepID=A0A0D1XHP0_9PEZI|nr:uncharacterized protein PV09_06932 [Verruconis gallopava]KIW01756.1 hypothetical protein PV09_06932 [Verruconis gallopava]
MGSYRPPQHGYGPPPGQDPHSRPGSTTYGQPGAHAYGSPITSHAPTWNQPQYQSNHYAGAPPPPPPPPPPPSSSPSNPNYGSSPAYQIQTVGGHTVTPAIPPRIPQPYGPPSTNVSDTGPPQIPSQHPPYGPSHSQSQAVHQRIPSVPPAYHQEVAQNAQGWPQHPQYSNQPATHHYDPPLPPRPGSQGRTSAITGGHQQQYDAYGHVSQPQYTGGQQYAGQKLAYEQQHAATGAQMYEPEPLSGSVYSPDDAQKYQHPPAPSPGGYAPPPPPPKPQGYHPHETQQPTGRPASVQYGAHGGQTYQSPAQQPATVAYAGGAQYEISQHQAAYGNFQNPSTNATGQQLKQQNGSSNEQSVPYGRQTPSQSTSRPGSRPPAQHQGYSRPSFGADDEPVSPIQSRQSISLSRPASVPVNDTPHPKPAPSPAVKPSASAFVFSSDWEHFGSGADEIDDTAMYGVKKDDADAHVPSTVSIELPASGPDSLGHGRAESEVSAPESFHLSPPVSLASGAAHSTAAEAASYVPSPPSRHVSQESVHPQPPAPGVGSSLVVDESDYIPPMPDTPPKTSARPARAPIVIGGSSSLQRQNAQPGSSTPALNHQQQPAAYAMQQALQQGYAQNNSGGLPSSDPAFVMGESGRWQDGQQFTSAAAPRGVRTIDLEELSRIQKENEELRARISSQEKELAAIRLTAEEKHSQLAERDGQIVQKDALLSQKDAEIAQHISQVSELQTSLTEVKETVTACKASISDLEAQLKNAEASMAELKLKLEQTEAAKSELSARLEQSDAALTAASQRHEEKTKELESKLAAAETGLVSSSAEVESLKKQLEEEKAKFEAKVAEPVDIAPGLEPWFKGSLERYKDMLYTESKPIPVQEKLQVFMDAVNAEARLRGIDMPFGPKGEVKGFNIPAPVAGQPLQSKSQPISKPERPRVVPPKESDGFVMVDPDAGIQFSPGGRPILKAPLEEYSPGGRPILSGTCGLPQGQSGVPPAAPEKIAQAASATTQEGSLKPAYQPFRLEGSASNSSNSSSKIPSAEPFGAVQQPKVPYTPFSLKQGDTAASAQGMPQTPPQDPTPTPSKQPAYKPLYKPVPGPAPIVRGSGEGGSVDILADHVPGIIRPAKKEALKSPQDEAMLPLPLKPRTPAVKSSSSDASIPGTTDALTASTSKDTEPTLPRHKGPSDILGIIAHSTTERKQSKHVQELVKAMNAVNTDYSFIKAITKAWEEKAAVKRKQLENERAKRQAELEAHNNELFDSGEIGYGDFETLEEEAKEKEMKTKAEEDMKEYESYAKEIFDVVYKRCQDDIGSLIQVQNDAEDLIHISSAGASVVSESDGITSLSEAMQLLLDVHNKLELVHNEVVKAVQERDHRYKLTQTKTLYAKGDIAGMKRVEKAFEDADKKADVRSRVERAERCKRVWKIMDTEMERGAGENEDFVADIIEAVEDASATCGESDKAELMIMIDKATAITDAVYEDSAVLMRLFENVDMDLNEREFEVSVASAKLKGDPKEYFDKLQQEKRKEDAKLKAEGEKRLSAVATHRAEAKAQLKDIAKIVGESSEEREARIRQEKALADARRRNGET